MSIAIMTYLIPLAWTTLSLNIVRSSCDNRRDWKRNYKVPILECRHISVRYNFFQTTKINKNDSSICSMTIINIFG